MAFFPRTVTTILILSFLFLHSPRPATAIRVASRGAYAYIGRKIGGRNPIEDVGTNREVQDLGRFSVAEYNRMRRGNRSHPDLVFSRVVEAESQVVAGVKYYLKIEGTTTTGGFGDGSETREVFESVVVVRPWERSKVMLDFGPSKPSPSSASAMIQGS